MSADVLPRIRDAFRVIERDVRDTDQVHRIEERAPAVRKGDSGVVREALSDQDVPVESPHLPDGKDRDAAE